MKELNVAIKAAKKSGKVLMKYYRKNIKIEKKSDRTPVTVADKKSEKEIVSIVKRYFPAHNFLGEEFSYKKTNSGFQWIIDPLDGTKNFVRGMPFFGNSIGLEKNGNIIAGVINMPAMNLIGYATKGNGAFINGKKINVSNVDKIEESFVLYGDVSNKLDYSKKFFKILNKCAGQRGYGDTIAYLLLAQGSADIFFDSPKPWDIAAAKIIVEEAGGRITDLAGNDTIYLKNSIATNGKLHNEVLKILRR